MRVGPTPALGRTPHCRHHLEILSNFFTRYPTFSCLIGSHKLQSQSWKGLPWWEGPHLPILPHHLPVTTSPADDSSIMCPTCSSLGRALHRFRSSENGATAQGWGTRERPERRLIATALCLDPSAFSSGPSPAAIQMSMHTSRGAIHPADIMALKHIIITLPQMAGKSSQETVPCSNLHEVIIQKMCVRGFLLPPPHLTSASHRKTVSLTDTQPSQRNAFLFSSFFFSLPS